MFECFFAKMRYLYLLVYCQQPIQINHVTSASSVDQRSAWRLPSKRCIVTLGWTYFDLASIVRRGANADRNVGEKVTHNFASKERKDIIGQ